MRCPPSMPTPTPTPSHPNSHFGQTLKRSHTEIWTIIPNVNVGSFTSCHCVTITIEGWRIGREGGSGYAGRMLGLRTEFMRWGTAE